MDYSLADHIEGLTLTGNAISATGNTLANTLTGNELDNILSGGAGDDVLEGGKGNDTIDGGLGQDTIRFSRGDGIDTVKTSNELYKLELVGISQDDMTFDITEAGILVINLGSGDQILFEGVNLYDSEDSLPLSEIRFVNDTQTTVINRDEISRRLESNLATHLGDQRNNLMFGSFGDDRMHGLSGNDRLLGLLGDDVLLGGSGNDDLYGGFGHDRLLGGVGDDYLSGSFGNDTLDGGTGNDWLNGGFGNDTYTLNLGDGKDLIYDAFGDNTIRFGSGINLENIRLERDGKALIIQYGDSDQVRVESAFKSGYFSRFFNRSSISVEFADSASMTLDELRGLLPVHVNGDHRNNRLYGAEHSDIISGMEGNDRLYGLDGDDVLTGGEGRDKLYGGNDSDVLEGGEGRDKLYGGNGNDVLAGGADNDTLVGGRGDDTYQFAIGDGTDTIYNRDTAGFDQLVMDAGIELNDLVFARDRNSLTVSIAGHSDSVTVSNWYRGEKYQLDSINVENYQLTSEMVAQLVQAQTSMPASTDVGGGSIPMTNEDVVTRFMGA